MSKSRYPLTEALGLRVYQQPAYDHQGEAITYVAAADLERVLASAPLMSGFVFEGGDKEFSNHLSSGDTHTARLLCVQPIVRDTAEGLLRDLLEHWDGPLATKSSMDSLLNRARALLAKGE